MKHMPINLAMYLSTFCQRLYYTMGKEIKNPKLYIKYFSCFKASYKVINNYILNWGT